MQFKSSSKINYRSSMKQAKITKIILHKSFRSIIHAYLIKLKALKLHNHSMNIKDHDYKLNSHNERLNLKIQSLGFLPLKQNSIYCLLHSRCKASLDLHSLALEEEKARRNLRNARLKSEIRR